LSKHCEEAIPKEWGNMLTVYVSMGYFGWDSMFWQFNDEESKKSCRNTMWKELRKILERS